MHLCVRDSLRNVCLVFRIDVASPDFVFYPRIGSTINPVISQFRIISSDSGAVTDSGTRAIPGHLANRSQPMQSAPTHSACGTSVLRFSYLHFCFRTVFLLRFCAVLYAFLISSMLEFLGRLSDCVLPKKGSLI
jgi:hypothetical protein